MTQKLVLLRFFLRLSIAFLWIFTGVISILFTNQFGYPLLTQAGIHFYLQPFLLFSASIVDIILGVLVLCRYHLKIVGVIQIIFTLIFTIIISIQLPSFWLHPFAPIAKNIPLMVATVVMIVWESDQHVICVD